MIQAILRTLKNFKAAIGGEAQLQLNHEKVHKVEGDIEGLPQKLMLATPLRAFVRLEADLLGDPQRHLRAEEISRIPQALNSHIYISEQAPVAAVI